MESFLVHLFQKLCALCEKFSCARNEKIRSMRKKSLEQFTEKNRALSTWNLVHEFVHSNERG